MCLNDCQMEKSITNLDTTVKLYTCIPIWIDSVERMSSQHAVTLNSFLKELFPLLMFFALFCLERKNMEP